MKQPPEFNRQIRIDLACDAYQHGLILLMVEFMLQGNLKMATDMLERLNSTSLKGTRFAIYGEREKQHDDN